MSSLKEIFSPGGPLAQSISGYRVREQQVDMAERIAAAINSCSVFIAEAGTGRGRGCQIVGEEAKLLPTWCRP